MSIPHVYDDGQVTSLRVSRFADAPREEQVRALTQLRRRSSALFSDLIAVYAVTISVLVGSGAIMVAGREAEDLPKWVIPGLEPGVSAMVIIASGLVAIAVVAVFFMRSLFKIALVSRRAQLLLAAYEDELRRRENARGWRARRWRKAHPIDWAGTRHCP